MSLSNVTLLISLVFTLSLTKIWGTPISHEVDSSGTKSAQCFAINARNVFGDEVPLTTPAGALLFRCVEFINSQFVFRAGKINNKTLETACEDTLLFSISEEEEKFPLGDKQSFCKDGTCVFYATTNQTVLLSALVLEEEVEILREEDIEIPFLVTEVLYEFDGLLKSFARSLLDAFTRNINDPVVLRTQVFLGSAETDCSLI